MKPKLKVVFDTNIYISAIIFGGNPRQCLELARNREVDLFYSKAILLELADKLQNKFNWSSQEVREIIEGISQFASLVSPQTTVTIVKAGPPGDKKHLLSLTKFQNIPILSAKQFLETFYN